MVPETIYVTILAMVISAMLCDLYGETSPILP